MPLYYMEVIRSSIYDDAGSEGDMIDELNDQDLYIPFASDYVTNRMPLVHGI